jgi:hypothetical protein
MHIDGDLLIAAYQCGWKQRDPGLTTVYLEGDPQAMHDFSIDHGLFDFAQRVTADSGNALVWCGADEGRRVKGFRAARGVEPLNPGEASCNRGQRNGIGLQYTLSTDVAGLKGEHVGLHVIGTKVFCTNSKWFG